MALDSNSPAHTPAAPPAGTNVTEAVNAPTPVIPPPSTNWTAAAAPGLATATAATARRLRSSSKIRTVALTASVGTFASIVSALAVTTLAGASSRSSSATPSTTTPGGSATTPNAQGGTGAS